MFSKMWASTVTQKAIWGNLLTMLMSSLQMLDMFDVMPFDDIDGGAWKQGWDVQYDDKEFDKEPLNVFVVPHSHNDPGKYMYLHKRCL